MTYEYTPDEIYVIEDRHEYEDSNGYDTHDYILDEDEGFFIDKSAAQARVDELNTPRLERYAKDKAAYDKAMIQWRSKDAKARALGFANPDYKPRWPGNPPTDLYTVTTVKRAEKDL